MPSYIFMYSIKVGFHVVIVVESEVYLTFHLKISNEVVCHALRRARPLVGSAARTPSSGEAITNHPEESPH